MAKRTTTELLAEASLALEKQSAELKKIRPLARGERLKKAEASLKPASRKARLREAENSVAASQPHDPRCCFAEMKPANN